MKKLKNEYESMMEPINKRIKPSFWERFLEGMNYVFLGLIILIGIILVLVLSIYLIENPISLAIICLTILFLVRDLK